MLRLLVWDADPVSRLGDVMIESIEFHNFKVLREATLRLGRFNLLVGPNGSGKTTVLAALRMAVEGATLPPFGQVASTGTTSKPVSVTIRFSSSSVLAGIRAELKWDPGAGNGTFGLGGEANHQTMANQFKSETHGTAGGGGAGGSQREDLRFSDDLRLSESARFRAAATLVTQVYNAAPNCRWRIQEEGMLSLVSTVLAVYWRARFALRRRGPESFCYPGAEEYKSRYFFSGARRRWRI